MASYTDEFRASAVLMLEAAGYPEKEGALTAVSKHLKMHSTTLRRWYTAESNPPPGKIVAKKKTDLLESLTDLLNVHIATAHQTILDANHGDVTRGIGILFDKIQLLQGGATENINNQVIVKVIEGVSER